MGGNPKETIVEIRSPKMETIVRKKHEKYIRYLHLCLSQQHISKAPKIPKADSAIMKA